MSVFRVQRISEMRKMMGRDVSRLKARILYRRLPEFIVPPRWMGRAYYDVERDSSVWVAVPLHWVVLAWWRVGCAWNRMCGRRTWIDREIKAAYKRGREDAQRDWYRNRT